MVSALSDSDSSNNHTSKSRLDFFLDLGLDHCDGLVEVGETGVRLIFMSRLQRQSQYSLQAYSLTLPATYHV